MLKHGLMVFLFLTDFRMAYQGGSQTLRYAIFTKNILTPEEAELYELANLAGVVADPRVFK